MDEEEQIFGCLTICFIILACAIFGMIYSFVTRNDPEPNTPAPLLVQKAVQNIVPRQIPEPVQNPPESPQIDENLIEGVVVRMIPGPHDVTTVVFEDTQYDLKLGPHKIYVGEWNQLRVKDGFVHEAYLGEGTIQEMARQ